MTADFSDRKITLEVQIAKEVDPFVLENLGRLQGYEGQIAFGGPADRLDKSRSRRLVEEKGIVRFENNRQTRAVG